MLKEKIKHFREHVLASQGTVPSLKVANKTPPTSLCFCTRTQPSKAHISTLSL